MEFIFILLLVIFIVCMCILCRHSDIAKIISLFLILIILQIGSYTGSNYDFFSAIMFGIADIILYSILLMIVPILMRIYRGKNFENIKGKRICAINSVAIWLILIFVSSICKSYNIPISLNVGWIGAIIYYFINYYITTETNK